MSDTSQFFNIKAFHGISYQENDEVELSFATVNRMANLTLNISFREYFTDPLTRVLDRLLQNLDAMPKEYLIRPWEQSLVDARETVRGYLEKFKALGDTSMAELIHGGFQEDHKEHYDVLRNLRRQGIYILTPPTICSCQDGSVSLDLQQALEGLLQHAPDLTYRDLYTLRKSEVSRQAVTAVSYALKAGLIYPLNTQQCCCRGSACFPTSYGSCIPLNGGPACDLLASDSCCAPPDDCDDLDDCE